MYAFLLNMWIMKMVDDEGLQKAVTLGRINQEQYNMIIMTPQNA